ncbi:MAG: hypothetical protein PHE24_05200 [Patescibacteria group bacterium]|nr:hypothetical protein [Patescibacteria group bacterium]
MSSEKNDSITSTKIKTVAVKRRIAEPKTELAELKEDEKLPKKSKLSVRVVGRELKVKESDLAAEVKEEKKIATETTRLEPGKKSASAKASPSAKAAGDKTAERGEKKAKKHEKDYFHRVSHRLEESKAESAHHHGKEKKKAKRETVSRPVGVYRKISVFFIILTLALLAAAFYFFLVSLTVEVTPKTERISDRLNIIVTNSAPNQAAANLANAANVAGAVEQIPVKEQKTYGATGANILGQEIIGKVSLINNYSQDKTLVATTRLLTSDGKLFRIKDKVFIPAGGSAEVEIYTDEPSLEMAIGPTTFTIPGLWAGLQDKIYAKSKTAFVYRSNVQKFVQNLDIEKAMQDIKESLVNKVNAQFTNNYKGYDKVIVQVDKNSLVASSSVKAGEKVDSFNLALSANVDIAAFQTADVKKLAEARLVSVMPAGEKFVGLNQNEIQYNVTSADYKNGAVNLEVPIAGTMALSDIDNAVDKTKLVGLTAAQINQYLLGLDKFSDIKLTFMPSFIRKAPSLVDRIKIIIK